jgi:hypothetical protein
MLSKVIGNKKIITGIITLVIISIPTFIITYNIVYNKTIEEENAHKEEEKKAKIKYKNRKLWIAKVTNTKGSKLNELVKLHKDYKLDTTILKLISELSTKFNVMPNKVMEALGTIDLSNTQITRQRVNLTLKRQKDKLYWLETKDTDPKAPWIKGRKEIITMCQLELALIDKAEKNSKIKERLQHIRAQYIHNSYPRIYKWKGEKGTPHH